MIIEGGNDALRLDINVDRYGKPVKVRDPRHRNSFSMSHRNGIWLIWQWNPWIKVGVSSVDHWITKKDNSGNKNDEG